MTTPKDDRQMSLTEVAEELGVHYMTAYRYVRLGMLPARKEGKSWAVERSDFEAFRSESATPTERGNAPWEERLLARMLNGDESGAWSVVEAAMASGVSVPDTYERMVIPALSSVGSLWEAGKIGVAEEHVASNIATKIIARLGPRMARRGVRRGTVVIGSTQTELHSIATTIAADLVRHAGFDVIDLGVNLPAESFASAVARADRPIAAAISVTSAGQSEGVRETADAIRAVSDVPILAGGRGISEDIASSASVERVDTVGDLIVALESILSSRS